MIRKTRGIVLHTTRYGESSLVVHCYTEQWGRQSYMVKGIRKSRKQNRSNIFQPLFILDLEVYYKPNRELQMVSEVSRAFPLNSIPYDLTKSTQAIFMAEVIYRVVREEEPNPMLAQFLVNTIRYLDALSVPLADYHIIFMFQLSRYLGFYPQKAPSEEFRYFDLANGRFEPLLADPDMQLDGATSILWNRYLNTDYQSVAELGFSSGQRKIILDQLIRFYKYHVDGMGEIRSLEVLHDFFHR